MTTPITSTDVGPQQLTFIIPTHGFRTKNCNFVKYMKRRISSNVMIIKSMKGKGAVREVGDHKDVSLFITIDRLESTFRAP